ncbi:hypothetical protein INR49_012294 [Caranx melampygus]|nr:hypothetical protein INR49_012294 [Caranx melampygus]
MGETCKEACVISLSFSVAGPQRQLKSHRMHILLAVLYVSLVAAPGCTSPPRRGDSARNTIHNIINIAQTTLVRIKMVRTKLPASPEINVTSPPIEGLNSISHDLELLDNELRSLSSNLLSQIQTDVSSMGGSVRALAQTMDCTIQDRPRGEISNSNNAYPESYLYQTLTKVQHYLETFILNKDKLEVC